MTPDDVAAIRANEHPFARSETTILALCDALEAAWADLVRQVNEVLDQLAEQRERAERAEAEAARWKCIADSNRELLHWMHRGIVTHADQMRDAGGDPHNFYTSYAAGAAYVTDHAEETMDVYRQRAKFKAALSRVRALCDEAREWGDGNPEVRFLEEEIRTAIEGDNK